MGLQRLKFPTSLFGWFSISKKMNMEPYIQKPKYEMFTHFITLKSSDTERAQHWYFDSLMDYTKLSKSLCIQLRMFAKLHLKTIKKSCMNVYYESL
jgi:hypothetical protein